MPNQDQVTGDIEIRRIGGRIGAIVEGIDLTKKLTSQQADAIRSALWTNKVIFFRDQNEITNETQVEFASIFGELGDLATPYGKGATHPLVSEIIVERGSRTDHWHTDTTHAEYSQGVGLLWPTVVPPYGGNTMWANTAAAYLDMPEELQRFAEQLWSVHSNRNVFADPRRLTELPPLPEEPGGGFTWQNVPSETIHPIVRVHPVTGERSLLVGAHCMHILGYNEFQSTDLRRLFQGYIERPDNVVRWQWQLGDVAVFDNRFTQHYVTTDYDADRKLSRISTLGGRSMSVDGRYSEPRIGDSSRFAPSMA